MFKKLAFVALSLSAPLFADAALAASAVHIKLSPNSGHPGLTIAVTGRGFAAHEIVDLSFDGTDEGSSTTLGNGNLHAQLTIPAGALPGLHRVKAVGRTDGVSARRKFLVQTDWPQNGFTAERTRDNVYENVLSPANVVSLVPAWTANVATGNHVSAPVVAGGVLYVTNSQDQKLYAFDAATGAALWTATANNPFPSQAAVANGVVYASTNTDFLAFDAATGALLWTASGVTAFSSPTVANGVVYIGDYSGNARALDAVTGAVLWTAPLGFYVTSSPAVAGGVVYIAQGFAGSFEESGNYYALDAGTGAILWDVQTFGVNATSPGVANGVVYAGSLDHSFHALNAGTGAQLWSAEVGKVATAPAIAEGAVYTGGDLRGNTRALDAFDAATGSLRWQAPLMGAFSAPAAANGVVYAGATDGNVYAFDAASGTKLWSAALGGYGSDVVVANGMVFITSGNSTVHAFALGTGAKSRKP